MWFVYFLVSQRHPKYIYVGLTNNIERRLSEHNAKASKLATAPYQPLELSGCLAVQNEKNAKTLEEYFKTGSGKAFLKKRTLPEVQAKDGA